MSLKQRINRLETIRGGVVVYVAQTLTATVQVYIVGRTGLSTPLSMSWPEYEQWVDQPDHFPIHITGMSYEEL